MNDFTQAKATLELLHGTDCLIEYRFPWPTQRQKEGKKKIAPHPFGKTKEGKDRYTKIIYSYSELTEELFGQFIAINKKGYHVFFSINKRKNRDISTDAEMEAAGNLCNNICIDFDPEKIKVPDGKTFGPEFLQSFMAEKGLPVPTALIGSGTGFHAWWHLAVPISIAKWREVQKRLNLTLDADGATNKPSGMMRLPGTENAKFENDITKSILLKEYINQTSYFIEDIEKNLSEVIDAEIAELEEKLRMSKKAAANQKAGSKTNEQIYPYNWLPVDVVAEVNDLVDNYKLPTYKLEQKNIISYCIWCATNHEYGTDVHPEMKIGHSGKHKGILFCHCGNKGTLIDLIIHYRELPNTGPNRKQIVNELDRKYRGFDRQKRRDETFESPLDNIRGRLSNVKQQEDESMISDCPVCGEKGALTSKDYHTPKYIQVWITCKNECSLADILLKSGISPDELNIKKKKIKKDSDYDEAKKIYKDDGDLPLFYGKEDNLQLLNDFLELEYGCDKFKYIVDIESKGKFWSFDLPTNTWTPYSDIDARNKIMYFLDRVWQEDGKKKYTNNDTVVRNLLGMLKCHDWTKERKQIDKVCYNFKPIADEKELGIDDELLIPHENGNLWVELKPPYRQILRPATTNHFHETTLPWKYKKYKLIKYEDNIGHFERVTNNGEVSDVDEICKVITSELQPKIHHDWFQGIVYENGEEVKVDDPAGRQLFYETGGYFQTGKNKEKKISYWLLESDTGKKVGAFQITQNIGEKNCFASKCKKASSRFGQYRWIGKRLVIFPDLKQNKDKENELIDFGQNLAEGSGGDVINYEGKNVNEENARPENHFLIIANDHIKIPDQQGEQKNRAIFQPWEHDVVADPDIVTNRHLCEDLSVEKEQQIFENLCLDADLARRKRGGEFSHSRFEAHYIREFVKEGSPWAKFVLDTLEPVDLPDNFKDLMSKEKQKFGVFTDLLIARAIDYFSTNEKVSIGNDPNKIGRKIATTFKKLEWKIVSSTSRREKNIGNTTKSTVCGIKYGVKFKIGANSEPKAENTPDKQVKI